VHAKLLARLFSPWSLSAWHYEIKPANFHQGKALTVHIDIGG
jgi:hypothetical protein